MATPIEDLMKESVSKLQQMIDSNTIVGETIITPDGATVIPVSKVSYGFGAGGCEFSAKTLTDKMDRPMFGGGCGGGVSVKPVSFLVVKDDCIRLLPVTNSLSKTDKIIDALPDLLKKFNSFIKDYQKDADKKKEACENTDNKETAE